MSEEFVIKSNQKGTDEHHAIEILLKGPELSLTKYKAEKFMDKDGHARSEARIRWWDASAVTLRELAEIPKDAKTPEGHTYPKLPNVLCPEEAVYDYEGEQAVFYGHYWREWPPRDGQEWTPNTVCVDFSAVKGGPLVRYRWDIGETISEAKFVRYGAS
jgi:hypothetical protein